jgi:ParB-like chromosome segregation protein Spo0J
MSNLATLADRYADIKAEIEGMERLLKEVKDEIKAAGREEIVGTRAIVTLGLSERNSLDTSAAKKFLTDDEIKFCTKTTLVETIRVKRLEWVEVLVKTKVA